MANWKENKVVGVVAGAVLVLALIFAVKGAMDSRLKKDVPMDFKKGGGTPAQEIAPRSVR